MSSSASSSLAKIRIVSINDVYELANLPRVQTFLSKLSPNPTAVVLAGDFLSPSTLSSIDNGRGMVATLRAMGLTHASLGNHEQDLRLESLHDRLEELSKSAKILNSNLRHNVPQQASWLTHVTHPYSLLQSSCQRVSIPLLGLLSDEPGVFRDNTFKKVPIQNILDSYEQIYNETIIRNATTNTNTTNSTTIANVCIPMTHASLVRDKELAHHMLSLHGGKSIIIGGHEHEPYNEYIYNNNNSNDDDDEFVQIIKTGMDANAASLIDLSFEIVEQEQDDDNNNNAVMLRRPILTDIKADIIEMSQFEPSIVVQKVVDKHMSVVKALENEIVIDANNMFTATEILPPGAILSSEKPRFQQTTVGTVFCQMIKEALEVDAAIINGAVIKGGKSYPDGTMSYAELKKELPFPTKMVVVPMLRYELQQAIEYSRTVIEDGVEVGESVDDTKSIPRRGYLQVDFDFESTGTVLGSPDDELRVAVPRNLLNGFCKNQILMSIGTKLLENGTFPGSDDYIPAMAIVVRHACQNRWFQLIRDMSSFENFDLNHDGVLDREEIQVMMTKFLGHEPPDFVVDDMINSIDSDENGVIDSGEFSFLLAKMEREHGGGTKFY